MANYSQIIEVVSKQQVAQNEGLHPPVPLGKNDFKNIQRRVYDVLNVLAAMDIIVKDSKRILYNGNSRVALNSVCRISDPAFERQQRAIYRTEVSSRKKALQQKRTKLMELMT